MGEEKKPKKKYHNIDTIHLMVSKFFNYDKDKIKLWYFTKNQLLGESSPAEMISLGRSDKLYRFVKGQILTNKP